MIQLRQRGWSYSRLGRLFEKDHTTIMYHCRKLGVVPHQPIPKAAKEIDFTLYEYRNKLPELPHPFDSLIYEKRNPGKSYREYLAVALTRTTERNYHKTYHTHTEVTFLRRPVQGDREMPEDYLPDA